MKTYTMKNRYDDVITFTQIADFEYKVSSSDITAPWRITGSLGSEITAVDPSGGPYIQIGYILPESTLRVVNITSNNGFILKVVEND